MTWITGRRLMLPATGLLVAACSMNNPAFDERSSVAELTGDTSTGGTATDSDASGGQESDSASGETDPTGDGDGEPPTGDGDGEPPTGDGDGEPATSAGDGDGDPVPGDGDGDEDTGSSESTDTGETDTGETDTDTDTDTGVEEPLCEELGEGQCGDTDGCAAVFLEHYEIFENNAGACSFGIEFHECIPEPDCIEPFGFLCTLEPPFWVLPWGCLPLELIDDLGLDECPEPPGPVFDCP